MTLQSFIRKFVGRSAARVRNSVGGGGRYHIVTRDVNLRERGIAETRNEADILDHTKRGKVLDMLRNQVRNSSTFNAILKQFDLNTVGTVGGKATFLLDSEEDSRAMREAFAKWAQSAEFYDGLRLCDLLKVVLKTYLVGGECVLLFDDGLVEDSGKVLVFEPDEVGNIDAEQFEVAFPAGWSQVQGHVRNANGRAVGVIVSKSQRGEKTFDIRDCYVLERGAGDTDADSKWINPRNVWRKNQVIGVSPAAASVATIMDLEDLANSELQAAKHNSQIVATIEHHRQEQTALPSAFDYGTDFSGMTDAEIAAAADDEAAGAVQDVSLETLRGCNVTYQGLPEDYTLKQLDTKHPNKNVQDFVDWVTGRAAAPLGLTRMYADMRVDSSFSGCQGEMNMSWPAFEETQKFLEQICDWILTRWVAWSSRRGELPVSLDGPIGRRVTWAWPRMRAVNAVDEQNAIGMRLKNCTGSFSEIYGADWREKLTHIGEEIAFCRANGIPHPATVTVSGAVIPSGADPETEAR